MSKYQYRILEQQLSSGDTQYRIERSGCDLTKDMWFYITDRQTIELARYAVELLKEREVVSERVVE